MRRGTALLLFLCMSAVLCFGTSRVLAQEVDYSRDVLPILAGNCYKCHGPDEGARQAELRVDTPEGVLRDNGGVVVPGKAGASKLIRRITSKDPDEVMPPPGDIRKLTPEQIVTLTRWVEQGAKWGTHWAFVPPVRPAVEKPSIDYFVRQRLEREKVSPSREADRATLIRRVTFDLTGLPPTLAEVDAFEKDGSGDAYEKVVDRLLASPRYGERMAADWLDLARYADTHGYQMDRYRAMWPYRDWVIKAFNENLPFDQFVTWQLAGDLLPDATKDQRLATAFNRLHMQNEEGGIVAEEFRVAYNVDRVTTAGTAFMGLTLDCARCHDHKYDPVTQKDFYALLAFFQNIDESGQTSYFTEAIPTPAMSLTTDEQDAKLAELRATIAAKEREIERVRGEAAVAFKQWKDGGGRVDDELSGRVVRCTFDDPAVTEPAKAVESPAFEEGKVGRAARLSGDNGFTLPKDVGRFSRGDAFSLSMWLRPAAHGPRMVVAHKSKASADAASRGYEVVLEDGRVAFGLHHFWPGDSIKVVTRGEIAVDRWTHVAVTYDGSSRAAGAKVYVDGAVADVEVVRDGLTRDITYGGDEPPLTIGHRFRDPGFKGGRVDEFCVYKTALTVAEVAQVAGVEPPAQAAMFEYFVARVYPESLKAAAELAALRREENAFVAAIPQIMVMREMATTKPAYVLKRGAYDAPGEAVTANTPGFLPAFPADQPRNRLGLARWLLAKENPLTARVIVNRAWQQMFGRGIVETSENFGTQGSLPLHPALLDFLACEFRDGMGWDMKRLLKTIAMSATYRQSSRAPAELLARDRANVLLARGPARRLEAEMIRDQALFAGGLLVGKIGGPSVKPYQPEGLWDVAMGRPVYHADRGEGLYRRSLYTFWKRSVPPPAMAVFDAADKNVCTARRQSTSTPLQALALLNDPQVVEAARFASQRMLTEGGEGGDARLGWVFRLVTSRAATGKELDVLRRMYDEQRATFAVNRGAAEKLLSVGEKRNDEKLDRADLAAGTVVALALFNHDAAVMRR